MRVDQVRCGPAVEAILGHARFGKVLEVVKLATLASTLEGLDLNEFAILMLPSSTMTHEKRIYKAARDSATHRAPPGRHRQRLLRGGTRRKCTATMRIPFHATVRRVIPVHAPLRDGASQFRKGTGSAGISKHVRVVGVNLGPSQQFTAVDLLASEREAGHGSAGELQDD